MDAKIELDLLHRGEMRMKSILDHCIIVLGKSRIGKSCTYNYILNKPMKGVNLDGDIVYFTTQNDSTTAKMGNSVESITLEPNISTLYADTSLLDLAGFGQNRTGADVMHVSYFLSILFDKVRKVKFILTFEDSMITANNVQPMTENFNEFISLFNYSALSPAIKKELLDSVSIVVTKARGTHQDYKKKMLKKAEAMKASQKLLIQNKEVIISMIESIAASNRIFAFKQAEEGVIASKQDLIGRLNQGGWKFLDIPKNKNQLRKSNQELVILPFAKDFKELSQKYQKNIENFLTQRIKKLSEGFSNLIRVYLQGSISNWKYAIKSQNNFQNLKAMIIDNTNFRKQVEIFLSNTYSDYKSQTLMTEIKFNKLSEVPLLALIDSTLKMKDILKESTNEQDKIETNLKSLLNKIINSISLLGNLCFNDQDYNQLKRVAFVMTRAVEQYLTFYKIRPDLVNDIHFKLRDLLEEAVGNSINYSKQVMNSINKEIMAKLFPTIDNLNYFQRLADEYFNYFTTNENAREQYKKNTNVYWSKYLMIKVNAEIIKFDISLKQLESIQSINHLENLFKQISVAKEHIKNNEETEQLKKKEMKYTMEAAKLVMKLDPKHYPNKSFRAIKIASLSKSFSLIRSFYLQALEEQKKACEEKQCKLLSKEYSKWVNNYTQFLLSWGKVEKASDHLHDHFDLFTETENFSERDEMRSNLFEIENSKQEYLKNVQNKNKDLKNYLTQDEVKQLKELLSFKITLEIPNSRILKVNNSQPAESQRVKTEANLQVKPQPAKTIVLEKKEQYKPQPIKNNDFSKKEWVNPQYKPEPTKPYGFEKYYQSNMRSSNVFNPMKQSINLSRNNDDMKNQQNTKPPQTTRNKYY